MVDDGERGHQNPCERHTYGHTCTGQRPGRGGEIDDDLFENKTVNRPIEGRKAKGTERLNKGILRLHSCFLIRLFFGTYYCKSNLPFDVLTHLSSFLKLGPRRRVINTLGLV